MNLETFEKWLNSSKKGDTLVYHKGFLVVESDKNYTLRNFAKTVMDIESKKLIHLFQKKIREDEYEYIAVRS